MKRVVDIIFSLFGIGGCLANPFDFYCCCLAAGFQIPFFYCASGWEEDADFPNGEASINGS